MRLCSWCLGAFVVPFQTGSKRDAQGNYARSLRRLLALQRQQPEQPHALLRLNATVWVVRRLPYSVLELGTLQPRSTSMLWLIWIAMMLAVPVVAGIGVWLQLHGDE